MKRPKVMTEKRPDCKLNWKNYQTIIFIEVLKRNCYLGIFQHWLDRTKYNWQGMIAVENMRYKMRRLIISLDHNHQSDSA